MKKCMPESDASLQHKAMHGIMDKKYAILVFAGLVKNAGKTTALNAVNTLFPDEPVGLTSIGYDGEEKDAVYHHAKPPVQAYSGYLVLTAERFLSPPTFSYEILERWGEHPQFGRWLILRLDEPAGLGMAGPSSLLELKEGVARLYARGAGRIHIDGALSRLSHLALEDAGIVLSTGAALGNSLSEVIERTRHSLELFRLPVFPAQEALSLVQGKRSSVPHEHSSPPLEFNAFYHEGRWHSLPHFLWTQNMKNILPVRPETIFLSGAFTDKLYFLLREVHRLPDRFVVGTPAQILLSPPVRQGLKTRGIELFILRKPNLLMLTLNSWHPLTPIPTGIIADSLLPYSHVPLIDVKEEKIWFPPE